MMTEKEQTPPATKPRSFLALGILGFLCLFFLVVFSCLGTWQVQRLGWKTDLITRVDARIHLSPVPAPPKAQWGNVTMDKDDYLPVSVSGEFLNDKEILVTTVGQDGTGYWLMVPFKTDEGSLVFINRGFIPMDRQTRGARQGGEIDGPTTVKGILRMSEGASFWPRKNVPDENRWYNRQIPAMAEKLGLTDMAPYFIDADATPNIGGVPVGGLTVISFPNNHLIYAVTWFSLALGMVAALVFLIYSEYRRRHGFIDD